MCYLINLFSYQSASQFRFNLKHVEKEIIEFGWLQLNYNSIEFANSYISDFVHNRDRINNRYNKNSKPAAIHRVKQ